MNTRFKKSLFLILHFFSIFGTIFCFYLIGPLRQKGSSIFYVVFVLGIFFAVVSCLLLVLINRYHFKKMTPLISVLINIFASAFIFTFVIRIITWIEKKSILKTTGLMSVLCIFIFIILSIVISLSFEFLKKKEKSITEKDL